MSSKFGLDVSTVATAEAAVRDADIIVTVTVADEPIVKDAWMKPGSFFSAVGSYQEEEFEVVLNSDRIVVDSLEHVLHRETPIVALMLQRNMITPEMVTNLGAIICDEAPKRKNLQERIFFSPIGMSTEDICLTKKVYDLAREKRIGQKLSLFGNVQ
jgi:ornithine cyclodeaminase/alanine dehydrogenase-like protein (mu-crystallin family)